MNFFAKLASTSSSWKTVGATRALVGACVAFAVAKLRGVSLKPTHHRALFWRSVLGTGAMMATFYSLSSRTLSLADTVTLLNLTPVFLAMFAPFVLREPTSGSVLVALAISLSGVVLILHPSFAFHDGAESAGPTSTMTAAFAVLAALLSSFTMMLLRRLGPTENAETIAVYFSLFAALMLGTLAVRDSHIPNVRDAVLMLAAGLCAGFGQIAMTRAYALASAAKVGSMSYLSVVVSALLGAAVLHERPGATAIVGMALVVAGGLVITLSRDKGA
jgi:drug/metabolite transporter (DMT)-like permease